MKPFVPLCRATDDIEVVWTPADINVDKSGL